MTKPNDEVEKLKKAIRDTIKDALKNSKEPTLPERLLALVRSTKFVRVPVDLEVEEGT